MTMPKTGGPTSTLSADAYGVAVDGAHVYWTSTDAIMKAPVGAYTANDPRLR